MSGVLGPMEQLLPLFDIFLKTGVYSVHMDVVKPLLFLFFWLKSNQPFPPFDDLEASSFPFPVIDSYRLQINGHGVHGDEIPSSQFGMFLRNILSL